MHSTAFLFDLVPEGTVGMHTPIRFHVMLRTIIRGLGILESLRYSAKSVRVTGAASMAYSLNSIPGIPSLEFRNSITDFRNLPVTSDVDLPFIKKIIQKIILPWYILNFLYYLFSNPIPPFLIYLFSSQDLTVNVFIIFFR